MYSIYIWIYSGDKILQNQKTFFFLCKSKVSMDMYSNMKKKTIFFETYSIFIF